MAISNIKWSDESVLRFAAGDDPIEKMERMARQAVLGALEQGWDGPPFDPIELARIRRIGVRPNAALADARVFWVKEQFQIEYNPHRPRGRVNFSIAHEIAHTLFDDCADEVRHRSRDQWGRRRWQLELLCNVGAAEITMPVGSFPSAQDPALTIEGLMRLRKEYQVSAEALLIRLVKLASSPVACFSATRMHTADGPTEYRMDYFIGSSRWQSQPSPPKRRRLASEVLDQCVALGTTASGIERWESAGMELHVEAVALPPLAGTRNLRIAGLVRPAAEAPALEGIHYRQGNAAKLVADSHTAILHIVNDTALRWGGRGFARAVRHEHPSAYEDYTWWTNSRAEERILGAIHVAHLEDNRHVVSLVAQRGYGGSPSPRIRYAALDVALTEAERRLSETGVTTVQMPRIGTGQAGGNWRVIEGLIRERLVSAGLTVLVFDLPPR